MDPGELFAWSRVLIVAGKGGVGKTATSAALALAAAQTGRTVLLVEVAGRFDATPMFGVDPQVYDPQGYDEQTIYHAPGGGEIRRRSITPDAALTDWLESHGFNRLIRRMAKSGILEIVATATPGIKDLLVLGKIKHLETSRAADVIVVDAPAAGHALHFLKAPLAVQQAVRSGVLRQQATETLEMLGDEQRCQALLVTIAEETPISELIETAFAVEDEVGLALGPVIVNGVLPNIAGLSETKLNGKTAASAALHPQQVNDLSTATIFRQKRTILQNQQLNFLTQRLPLPQVYLPALFTSLIGLTELQTLADAFAQSIRHQASR